MRIHRILDISNANGPGSRFVVWVQGCSRNCPGCFNPQTHDPCAGYELDVSEIIKQIPLARVGGITVSGGEPFEQAEELLALLEETGQKGLNRLVYSGYTYEELLAQKSCAYEKCLSEIDLLIDGAYEKENLPFMPWTGSGNQRLIQLHCGRIKKIYEKNDIETALAPDGEIIIDKNGGIITTGIFDSRIFL
jgi:anaerobic ribonucleoside-triphosphate reductase activating protein